MGAAVAQGKVGRHTPKPKLSAQNPGQSDGALTIMMIGRHMDGLQAFMTMLDGTSNAT